MRLTTVLLGLMMLAGCAAVQDSPPGWGNNQRVELYTRLGLGYMEQNRLLRHKTRRQIMPWPC